MVPTASSSRRRIAAATGGAVRRRAIAAPGVRLRAVMTQINARPEVAHDDKRANRLKRKRG